MSAAQELLAALGVNPDDTLSVAVGNPRRRRKIRAADIDTLLTDRDVWWSVNPTDPETATATTKDVARVAALMFELDFKDGGTMENSVATVKGLTEAFGPVSAVVRSGGGLHVYIGVADGYIVPDVFGHADAARMAERLGKLVQRIAEKNGAVADSVFDTTRLLRVPGTTNSKYDPPRRVVGAVIDGAAPYLRADILERLDAAEKQFPPPPPPPAAARPPAEAGEAGADHPYITAAVDRELARLAQCPESGGEFGGRAAMLYRVALNLGCWRQLDRERLRDMLTAAANTCGLNEDPGCDIDATITNGFRDADKREPNRVPASTLAPLGDTTLVVPAGTGDDGDDGRPWLDPHMREGRRALAFGEWVARIDPHVWESSPNAQAIRDAALSRGNSPWTVLAHVRARVLSCIPHTVTLPDYTGAVGNLNTFTGIVGLSGRRKGTVKGLADRLAPDSADTEHLGSGEGLIESFWVDSTDEKGKLHWERRHSVLLVTDESDMVAKLTQRQGATLSPLMREAWSGDDLAVKNRRGHGNVPNKVEGGTYACQWVCATQPAKAHELFGADLKGGLTQRMLFVPTEHGARTPAAYDRHRPIGKLDLPRRSAWQYAREFQFPPGAEREIIAAIFDEDFDPLATHLTYGRMKAAVFWAILNHPETFNDGVCQVTEQDWELAAIDAQITRATFGWLLSEARIARGDEAAETEAVRHDGKAKHEAKLSREIGEAAAAVVAFLREQPGMRSMNGPIQAGVGRRHRRQLRAAYGYLAAEGVIRRDPPGKGRGGEWVLELPDWAGE